MDHDHEFDVMAKVSVRPPSPPAPPRNYKLFNILSLRLGMISFSSARVGSFIIVRTLRASSRPPQMILVYFHGVVLVIRRRLALARHLMSGEKSQQRS
jgi:hypothetical protein